MQPQLNPLAGNFIPLSRHQPVPAIVKSTIRLRQSDLSHDDFSYLKIFFRQFTELSIKLFRCFQNHQIFLKYYQLKNRKEHVDIAEKQDYV